MSASELLAWSLAEFVVRLRAGDVSRAIVRGIRRGVEEPPDS